MRKNNMNKKIDPNKIKMVKMPDTPFMAELNRKMYNAKTEKDRDVILKQMEEYMKKMGLVPSA
jgi:hypothetical protein